MRPKRTSKLWILAVIPIVAIPFENQYTILGFSVAKLTIVPLLLAVLIFRFSPLLSVMKNPIFLSGMAFLGWAAACEGLHPYADFTLIYRVLQVFLFAALLAVVSADRLSLKRVIFAIAGVCSLISVYLVINFYGIVSMDVETVREAGRLRGAAFQDMSLSANLNILGYTAGMGAIVALPQFLSAKKVLVRILWATVYVLCFVGCLVPLSRGAMVAVVASSVVVLWRSFSSSIKPGTIVLAMGVAVLLYALTPEALTSRFSTVGLGENSSGKADSRAGVTNAALASMPDYWTTGVGSGQYWDSWARKNGFLSNPTHQTGVLGPHNGFLAAWIYFGLPGLVLLCLVCFYAGREGPRRTNKSWEASALVGLSILGLVWLAFTHNFYLKAFGVILGLLMAQSWTMRDKAQKRERARMAVRRMPRYRKRPAPSYATHYMSRQVNHNGVPDSAEVLAPKSD